MNLHKFLCQSTGPVDREKTESKLLLSVDRSVDRYAHMHKGACRSTDTVDRQRNSALPAVDRAVDRTQAKNKFSQGILKMEFFW